MKQTSRRAKSQIQQLKQKTKTPIKHLRTKTISHDDDFNEGSPLFSHKLIHNHISSLHPFSSFAQKPVDDTLDRVVHIYQEGSKKRVNSSPSGFNQESTIGSSSRKMNIIRTLSLKKQCRDILKMTKRKKTKTKSVAIFQQEKTKNTLQPEIETENELANQLIAQTKWQKKEFKSVLNKFKNLLQEATSNYASKHNINIKEQAVRRLGPKKLQQEGAVCKSEIDQAFSFQKIFKKRPPKYQGKRDDIYLYIKKSNRMLNIVKIEDDFRTNLLEAQFTESLKKAPETSQMLYKQYFRGKKLNFLHHALDRIKTVPQ